MLGIQARLQEGVFNKYISLVVPQNKTRKVPRLVGRCIVGSVTAVYCTSPGSTTAGGLLGHCV